MTTLMTTEGDLHFDNQDIQPITQCPRCQSTQLQHDFTAGYRSDQYSSSDCQTCGMRTGFCMGMWVHTLYLQDETTPLEVWWWLVPPHLQQLFDKIRQTPVCIKSTTAEVRLTQLPLTANLSEIKRIFEQSPKEPK